MQIKKFDANKMLLQQNSPITMSAQNKKKLRSPYFSAIVGHTSLLSLDYAIVVQAKLIPATQRGERLRVVVIIALQTAGQGDGAIPAAEI